MARVCTICTHHRRDAMDKQLLRGEQLKAVARRYSVSEDALGRHKRHMQLVIAKAAALVEQKYLAYGSDLLAEIARRNPSFAHPVNTRCVGRSPI